MQKDERAFPATVIAAMEAPEAMVPEIEKVLAGEYEAGFSGDHLTVLDIGANVGAFSLWANLRWPNSRIHAYEPHPETFGMLRRNVAHLPNIKINNVALWPTTEPEAAFFSRYPGDGEAGLTAYINRTFATLAPERIFSVAVNHPNTLPQADVIKLDVEGAEWEILRNMDLSDTSLILLEYQTEENREAIKHHLAGGFTLEFEDRWPWKDILEITPLYRRDLAGNHYGRLFFSRTRDGRLRRVNGDAW